MKASKKMPKIALTLLVAGLAHADSARAETYPLEPLIAVARAAVAREVADFNSDALAGDSTAYPRRLVASLRDLGMDTIDPEYLAGKCFFDEAAIESALDRRMTAADERTAGMRGALGGMKATYGRRVWKLVSLLCSRAEARFDSRLAGLTERGDPIALSPELRDRLREFVFSPTEAGKPSARKTILAVFEAALTGAMVIGSSGSLLGLPIAGKIISMSVFTNSSRGFLGQLRSRARILRADGLEAAREVRFDLLPEETAFLR